MQENLQFYAKEKMSWQTNTSTILIFLFVDYNILDVIVLFCSLKNTNCCHELDLKQKKNVSCLARLNFFMKI